MSYNTKNYTEQGGEKTVIGGTLEIANGASVTGIAAASIVDNLTSTDTDKALSAKQGKVLKDALDAKVATNVAEAAGAAPTAAEFKALLDALIAAGLMAGAE